MGTYCDGPSATSMVFRNWGKSGGIYSCKTEARTRRLGACSDSDTLLDESRVPDRAAHDEDAHVVRTWIGRTEKEPRAFRPVAQRGANDHLAVEEGPLALASDRPRLECLPIDVRGIPIEVADEEHRFQPRQRDNHLFARRSTD